MSTHLLEGSKREERLGELLIVARHKRALTNWRGGRGRSGLVSFETWHVTNEHSLPGGEEEGGAAWWASERGTAKKSNHTPEVGKSEEPVCRALNGDTPKTRVPAPA